MRASATLPISNKQPFSGPFPFIPNIDRKNSHLTVPVLPHTEETSKGGTNIIRPAFYSIPAITCQEGSQQIASSLVGESTAIKEIREIIAAIAPSNIKVLITGETGTGKELVAHDIYANSLRKDKPFIPVNCTAISKNTIESELFGHEHGAFTDANKKKPGLFEAAHEGTLFLDEGGELDRHFQAKLNRVVEYGTFQRVGGSEDIHVNVRVILATNCDIVEALRSRKIDRGFYDRIAGIHIHMSPLRDRKEDIPLLAEHLLQKNIFFAENKEIFGFTESAMEKLMSYDWPGNVRELENVIKRAIILTKNVVLDEEDIMLTSNEARAKVLGNINEVARSDTPVFITGETGVGKEIIARRIHENSNRYNKPFITVNCATLTSNLAESELFGHVKGAFTGAHQPHRGYFEQADGGTLFLDEIGELSPEIRIMLLRTLQEGEITVMGTNVPKKVDVRIIAATNASLEKEVEEGRFRKDLYHRLAIIPIHILPLRERKEEIPSLANEFLHELKGNKNITRITEDAMRKLIEHDWPGNIRELKAIIERAVIFTKEGNPIRPESIIIYSIELNPQENKQNVLKRHLNELQEYANSNYDLNDPKLKFLTYKLKIVQMLLESNGKRLSGTEIAEKLGINRNTLHKYAREFGCSSTKELVEKLSEEIHKN